MKEARAAGLLDDTDDEEEEENVSLVFFLSRDSPLPMRYDQFFLNLDIMFHN